MLEAIVEFLESLASDTTADALVTHAGKIWTITKAAAAAALLFCLATSVVRRGQRLWRWSKQKSGLVFYHTKAATSPWLTRAALVWYASLVGVTLHYKYLAGEALPEHLPMGLFIGTCCLLAHTVYTLIRWSRTPASAKG